MKKGNMTTLASVFVIALVALGVGMGTVAYFTDTETATGNTFTAGTLDVKLSTEKYGTYTDDLENVWVSPLNWAPGGTFTRTIWFKNEGNVPVMVTMVDLYGYSHSEGHYNFKDEIEIVELYESYEGWGFNWAPWMANYWGDKSAPLTLREVMDTLNVPGGVDDQDMILFATSPGGCEDPECTATSYSLMDGVYLAPNGAIGFLKMTFKFSNDAPDTYQGASCGFDLKLTFVQGPASGICRHELPGFQPGT